MRLSFAQTAIILQIKNLQYLLPVRMEQTGFTERLSKNDL